VKRSKGVTILAAWLILSGVFATLIGIGQVVARPTLKAAFEQKAQQFSKSLDQLPRGTSPGQIAPERIQHFRELLAQGTRDFYEGLQSPITSIILSVSFLLAVTELIAGVAIFLPKSWGRLLAVGESLLSLCIELWSKYLSPASSLDKLQHEFMQSVPEHSIASPRLWQFYRGLSGGFNLVFDLVFPILWTVR